MQTAKVFRVQMHFSVVVFHDVVKGRRWSTGSLCRSSSAFFGYWDDSSCKMLAALSRMSHIANHCFSHIANLLRQQAKGSVVVQ